MNGLDIIQGSPEWHQARLGRVTASRVADIVRRTKTGYSTSRANYMAELIAERLTGTAADSYKSPAMQWGTDHEADARSNYEFMTDSEVVPVGFVEHPAIGMTGASPDGFVGADGLVEFKCPLTSTHLDTLLGGKISGDYITQVQWQMACLPERQWCDWASFDPRLPASMRLFIQRVPRNDKMIEDLNGEVIAFLVELNDKLAALRAKYELRAAA